MGWAGLVRLHLTMRLRTVKAAAERHGLDAVLFDQAAQSQHHYQLMPLRRLRHPTAR